VRRGQGLVDVRERGNFRGYSADLKVVLRQGSHGGGILACVGYLKEPECIWKCCNELSQARLYN
jgi:hypothetical protein